MNFVFYFYIIKYLYTLIKYYMKNKILNKNN